MYNAQDYGVHGNNGVRPVIHMYVGIGFLESTCMIA
jgi:hypothetical protein